MPSLTTVTLTKRCAFSRKKTIHTKSPSSSSPSFLDIAPALSDYLSFPLSFTQYSFSEFPPAATHPSSFQEKTLPIWQSFKSIPFSITVSSLCSKYETSTLHTFKGTSTSHRDQITDIPSENTPFPCTISFSGLQGPCITSICITDDASTPPSVLHFAFSSFLSIPLILVPLPNCLLTVSVFSKKSKILHV